MPSINCDNCLQTFASPGHCNSHICSHQADHLSNCVSISNSISDSSLSVLKNNTSVINTDALKRSSLDTITQPEMKKFSKMLKEIEDCGLDISTVTSRTRRSYSASALETKISGGLLTDLSSHEKASKQKSLPNANKVDEVKREELPNGASDKENTCLTRDGPPKEAEQSSTVIYNAIDIKVEKVNDKLPAETTGVDQLLENQDSGSYRTDEIDRMAKSINKLSFTCDECAAEFETFSQFKTHQVLHDFESHKTVRPWSPAAESESATDYVSSSETLSEYKSPVKKQLSKRIKLEYEAPVSDLDHSESPEDQKSDDCEKRKLARYQATSIQKINANETKPETAPKSRPKCDNCAKEFSSVSVVKSHKLTSCKHGNISDLKEWIAVNNIPEFGCGICGLGFEQFDQLQCHRSNDHQNFQMPQKKYC